MAIVRPSNETGNPDYSKKLTVTAGQTSDWYLVPSQTGVISVELLPGAGATAVVETTNDIEGAIAGTAIGMEWDFGQVSNNTDGYARGKKCVRVRSIAGDATLFINAVRA